MKQETVIKNTHEDSGTIRRDTVKNIAIIFLAVMLVLTFFSNTIMNMSLPQVSAQYADRGNISEQIRGSGVVSAGHTYNVNVDETRVVSSVNVKTGDTVKKGDVIYTLEGKESPELTEAEKTLSDMEYEYRKALIDAGAGADYLAELDEIKNAEEDIEEIRSDIESFGDDDFLREKYASEYLEIEQLKSDISEQQSLISDKYKNVSDVKLETMASGLEDAIACLDTDDYSALPGRWYKKITAADDKVKLYEKKEDSDDEDKTPDTAETESYELKRLKAKQSELEGYIAALGTEDMIGLPNEYYNEICGCIDAAEETKTAYENAEKDYKDAQEEVDQSDNVEESIRAKNKEIKEKIAEVDELHMEILNYTGDYSEIGELYKRASKASRELEYLQDDLSYLVNKSNMNRTMALKLSSKQGAYKRAKKAYEDAAKSLADKKKEYKRIFAGELNDVKEQIRKLENEEAEKEEAKRKQEEQEKADKKKKNEEKKQAEEERKKNEAEAKKELGKLKREAKLELKTELKEVNAEITARKNISEKTAALKKAEAAFDIKLADDKRALKDSLKEKERNLEKLKTSLSSKQLTDGIADKKAREDLNKKADDIGRQKDKVSELKEKSLGGNVTAPVDGVINSLAYRAGETTSPGNPAAVIDIVDKGFVISFSVKAEQAKKVSVGTNADISNNYFGKDLTAQLTAIKTDTASPQTNKLLEFTITGEDVRSGDNISIVMGGKGQDYPAVVPNSAMREDSNGKYVLVAEAKSSALGNRYFAVRCPVNVLAQNDSKTAVSGLAGGEFVITASSAPIQEGQQIKLAEA